MRGVAGLLFVGTVAGCAGIFGVSQLSDTDASVGDDDAIDVGTTPSVDGPTVAPGDATMPPPQNDGGMQDQRSVPSDASGSGSGSGNLGGDDTSEDITDADFGLCTPFSQTGCKLGLGCQIDYTDAGDYLNYSCWFVNDAGLNASCTATGECANGLTCVYVTDTTLACWYPCYIPGAPGGAPFDASGLPRGLGTGGCPSGYSCEGSSYSPPWLGLCVPPGAD